MPVEAPRRPDIYVLSRFLGRLAERSEGWTRSRLQTAVRVNYDVFRAYEVLLDERGLAEAFDDADGGRRLRLTDKGRVAHQEIEAWILDVLGDVFR